MGRFNGGAAPFYILTSLLKALAMQLPVKNSAIVMTADGKLHKMTLTEVNAKPTLMAALAKDFAIKHHNLWETPDFGGLRISMLSKSDGQILLTTRLNKLILNTQYEFKDNTYLPVYKANTNSIPMKFDWIVPTNMYLYFGMVLRYDEYSRLYIIDKGYMYAVLRATPGYWKFPISNIFEDGMACLGLLPNGRGVEGTTKSSLYELGTLVLNSFMTNLWNDHLMQYFLLTDSQKMFSFTAEGKSTCPQNWTDYCKKINNLHIEDMATLYT